jgi:alpha 1,2-mannosyltransferase
MALLDLIARRPQRLIMLAAGVLLFLSLLSWLSLDPSPSTTMRSSWQALPRPWKAPASASGSSFIPGSEGVADAYTHAPGRPSSIEELTKWAEKGEDGNLYPPQFVPSMANQGPRAKAGFIVLVRNNELHGMKESMKDGECCNREG